MESQPAAGPEDLLAPLLNRRQKRDKLVVGVKHQQFDERTVKIVPATYLDDRPEA
jgi:hypothetical protein